MRQRCAEDRLLTISGDAELARAGEVAVALGRTPDGRPRIVVSLRRVHAESHELSAELLQLSQVVP